MATDKVYFYYTSPNQKCVITKKTQSDKEHTYALVNLEAMFTAASELSDRAFKLYSRLNMHCDGYTYGLSPVEIHNTIGMSEDRYRSAVKELIKKGYLVQSEKQRNLYTFFEYPKRDSPVMAAEEQEEHPETTLSPVEPPQNTLEKTHTPYTQSHPRNITDITSHNTRDNTVSTTSNNTEPYLMRQTTREMIDDISSFISGNSTEYGRSLNNSCSKTYYSSWSPEVKMGGSGGLVYFDDDEELPF